MISYVNKLIIRRMSVLAIPPGSDNGLSLAINFLTNQDNLEKTFNKAKKWVEESIAKVKSCQDNPYGNDDEAIAKAILDMAIRLENEKHT